MFQDFRPFADDVRIAEPGSKTFKHAYLRIESGTKVVQYTKVYRCVQIFYVSFALEHEVPL